LPISIASIHDLIALSASSYKNCASVFEAGDSCYRLCGTLATESRQYSGRAVKASNIYDYEWSRLSIVRVSVGV